MKKDKHAYLIMAHRTDDLLKTLLHMLDDDRNDIYLHMDRKCQNFNSEVFQSILTKSHLVCTPRISVTWGGYSQIEAELILLREAAKKDHYQYYHLISGQDLPIQNQDYIHAFFEDHKGKEFLGYDQSLHKLSDRYSYYYFFQNKIGRGNSVTRKLENVSIRMQKGLRINRSGRNKNITFYKGTNWFSITDDLTRYILSKRKWISDTFRMTKCCDEVFIQTLAGNSQFLERIYDFSNQDDNEAAMRLIDWKRGRPYVFRSCDFKVLISSNMLFARKFDSNVDRDIIREVEKYYS